MIVATNEASMLKSTSAVRIHFLGARSNYLFQSSLGTLHCPRVVACPKTKVAGSEVSVAT